MSFCAVPFSIVFHRERDQVCNADKFVKQFGQFVYQTVSIWSSSDDNSVLPLTRLRLVYWWFYLLLFFFYFSTLRCKTLCDVTKPFFRVSLDDQFWCFDCLHETQQKRLIGKLNDGGSENIVQTSASPCAREMVRLKNCLNGAFCMDSKIFNEKESSVFSNRIT